MEETINTPNLVGKPYVKVLFIRTWYKRKENIRKYKIFINRNTPGGLLCYSS